MTQFNFSDLPLFDFDEIDSLIWDWNGTLLDDVEVNLKVVNEMLSRRGLKQLNLLEYKELFCFPVQSFHKRIGFDLEREPIEMISVEYHTIYKSYESDISLNADTTLVIDSLIDKGIDQYILSAAMKSDLMKNLSHFDIASKFKGIYGVSDIYAAGKVEIGKQLMHDHFLDPQRTLIIGDTLHDAEVAGSLGVKYLLFSGGHNSNNLLTQKSRVIDRLIDIIY